MAYCYIAGPMRGYPQFNFPAFDDAKLRGQSLGWKVISPADMDRSTGFDPNVPVEITPDMSREFFRRDMEAVGNLRAESGDAIAMLPGWEKSTGASCEHQAALWLGLRVLDARTFNDLELSSRHPVSERFHKLLDEIGKLHDRKQADYGTPSDPFANVRASKEWGIPGWIGALIRLNDKIVRLKTFARKGALANESAQDSMLDISVYALIAYLLYEDESSGDPTSQAA